MDYIWLILALASSPSASLFFKAGMLKVGKSPEKLSKLPRFFLRTYTNPLVLLGIVLIIVFMVTYSFAMSVFPVSFIYPVVNSIPIVLITVFCLLLFKEKVSRMRWLGIAIICVGVVLLGVAMD